MLYDSLYAQHDSMLQGKLAESARIRDREARLQSMGTRMDTLSELPALSSFLQIQEDCDPDPAMPQSGIILSLHQPQPTAEESQQSPAVQKRDGFERMRRCQSQTYSWFHYTSTKEQYAMWVAAVPIKCAE
jgi:hypothetical protein